MAELENSLAGSTRCDARAITNMYVQGQSCLTLKPEHRRLVSEDRLSFIAELSYLGSIKCELTFLWRLPIPWVQELSQDSLYRLIFWKPLTEKEVVHCNRNSRQECVNNASWRKADK